jgi:surface polysaccharide O-acyltransferase-like enzyme
MRGIAAFLVVCIHIPFPNIIGETLIALARIAVPFFFIVSGFFLYGDNREVVLCKTKKHLNKALIIVVSANVIYLIWNIIKVMVSNESVIEYLKSSFTLKNMIKLFTLNESPFGYHLWYLSAYLYVLIIFYFITKFNILKLLYYAIPPLLLILIAGQNTLSTLGFELPIIVFRNFIFVGMPYFLLGNLIRYKQDYIINKTTSNYFLILGIIFFTFTTLFEKYILDTNNISSTTKEHYFSSFFMIITIFIFLIKNPLLFRNNILETMGNKYSLEIYIIHPIIIFILDSIISKIGGKLPYFYSYIAPFIVYLTSVTCVIIYSNVKKLLCIHKVKNFNTQF